MSLLEIKQLHAAYRDVPALKEVSITVDTGEIVAVVGANAAGKSSLLRAISGLIIQVTSGAIEFKGDDLRQQKPQSRAGAGLVHIPESRRLFDHMTVQENMEMGATPARARPKQAENLQRVFELFPMLAERRRQYAGSLSGGEQQMCAIGRGLMADPELLLVDEPTLGLAPLVVEQIFELLTQIRAQGITVLLVEQNAVQSLQVADRAYVLQNGEIDVEGTPEELAKGDRLRLAYMGR